MILAEIIDRIEVGAGYKINIEFKITARQFLEPDVDAAGDQKLHKIDFAARKGGFFVACTPGKCYNIITK